MSGIHVALLRGINVGGSHKVPMVDLRDEFERAGCTSVRTYIQSGNVVFAGPTDADDWSRRLEARFGFPIPVAIRSGPEMESVVASAPAGFSTPEHRCDVVFLRSGVTVDQVLGSFVPRAGVDESWPGPGVVYVRRLDARAAQSRFSKIVSSPVYPYITVRNWRTTTTLATLATTATTP